MTPPRQRLLAWYRDAAQTLASSHARQHAALLDGEAPALHNLLGRQALSLLAIAAADGDAHDATTPAATSLVEGRLEDLASVSLSKLYAYRYDRVPYHWRQIYADTLILRTLLTVLQDQDGPGPAGADTWLSPGALDRVVENLDRALITAGGAGVLGREWIERTLALLEELDRRTREPAEEQQQQQLAPGEDHDDASRPRKRRRATRAPATWRLSLSTHEPHARPGPLAAERRCPRVEGWSLVRFERYMNAERPPRPVVFTDLAASWPALGDRPWKSREYLLSRTFGGRRLVPVEVGRSYVDEHWGQELVPFGDFLARHVVAEPAAPAEVGYLAQHDLFQQVPQLRNDVAVPDYCWAAVPGPPVRAAPSTQPRVPLEEPLLNAWFGPARTITPLHTDGYHNLLVQVVGTKYVRLYAPWTEGLRPRGAEHGVDMSNTSALDVGVLEGWDEAPASADDEDLRRARRDLAASEYWECILGEGDALLIPMGWWHYVRSLSVSFSVSFWWD
ncbi:hypothetical protein E4U53_002160 [Claviceps sorghi]|nr:hypothetical protein E4U53_002160 [Claviceps sorghi]